ncbi:lytic transglycosylase domain-containing protein [Sphingobium sp. CR2-8]|uniref:lytic transglycosylase domain-containing protein n=1 Tax=Sphingobium sp. CR2-8 TaxID=1306534 RepID=UPI002DBAA19B|nr:lytic transglycosylase domain-containing protein [Sphingobium sp. CR2-8]MEC3909707.1 lytic transglycosylase domain-containing protein [Sphingobium sp. CR2-8]
MTGRLQGSMAVILATMIVPQLCIGSVAIAQTQGSVGATSPDQPYAGAIAEAAQQFAIPTHWIRAVMDHESGGNPRALSRAGAMGLMQIMPPTWDMLAARHRLGPDPYDPRDNIIAGAAYLREMHDRYGIVGMLAAYNAGPGRYEAYLRFGRPLPAETRAYLARLLPIMDTGTPREAGAAPLPPRPFWTEAALFPRRAVASAPGAYPAPSEPQDRTDDAGHRPDATPVPSLFVARSGARP